MIDFHGEFLSFNYRGINSAEMGIVRVSDGSRLHTDLLPPSEDRSVTVDGHPGELLVSSWHTARTFSLDIAYDGITEQQKRRLREWLNGSSEGPLYFEEHKYKVYQVRVVDEVRLDFIPFDINEGEYVYKGEGQITFKAYYPYAVSPVNSIEKGEPGYRGSNIPSPEVMESLNYNKIMTTGQMRLFNAGEVTTPLSIVFKVKDNSGYQVFTIREDDQTVAQLVIDLSKLEKDISYTLDSKTRLLLNNELDIECNRAIVAGTHLTLPPTTSVFSADHQHYLETSPSRGAAEGKIEIEDGGVKYSYLYY